MYVWLGRDSVEEFVFSKIRCSALIALRAAVVREKDRGFSPQSILVSLSGGEDNDPSDEDATAALIRLFDLTNLRCCGTGERFTHS